MTYSTLDMVMICFGYFMWGLAAGRIWTYVVYRRKLRAMDKQHQLDWEASRQRLKDLQEVSDNRINSLRRRLGMRPLDEERS